MTPPPPVQPARLLSSASALLWGLQFAFLNPVLALLLTSLYDATPADVGWVLVVYNVGGFIASLVLPGWADRTGDYLRAMLICGVLTIALAGTLALATALPLAVIALVVLGGPAGVGSTLLYAGLRHAGAATAQVMNTRAIVSFAWVAGPPVATLLMGALGDRSILVAIAVVGVGNVITTILMLRHRRAAAAGNPLPTDPVDPGIPAAMTDAVEPTPAAPGDRPGWPQLIAILLAFVLLQATNNTIMTVMTLFVTAGLDLPVFWGGIVLGVAALLEIPALWLIGRFSGRFSSHGLLISGCVAAVVYYAALAFVHDPIALIALQVLNAWSFAALLGIGMTFFQEVIRGAGIATGIFMNTRRVGAILTGPIIAIAGIPGFGYPGMFLVCAALTAIAAVVLLAAQWVTQWVTRHSSRA
ncbi:MFS transporter [Microbacterium sp.]|uniref:MFS transporter n=1 Tax=Microbacterium sp. TaxID=51671 RepID=UPI0039E40C64